MTVIEVNKSYFSLLEKHKQQIKLCSKRAALNYRYVWSHKNRQCRFKTPNEKSRQEPRHVVSSVNRYHSAPSGYVIQTRGANINGLDPSIKHLGICCYRKIINDEVVWCGQGEGDLLLPSRRVLFFISQQFAHNDTFLFNINNTAYFFFFIFYTFLVLINVVEWLRTKIVPVINYIIAPVNNCSLTQCLIRGLLKLLKQKQKKQG